MLSAIVVFEDDSQTLINTDKSWLVRKNSAYVEPNVYDGSIASDEYTPAEEIEDIWHCTTAMIPAREEHIVESNTVKVPANSKTEVDFDFDKIYGGFVAVSAKTKGRLNVEVFCMETESANAKEVLTFVENTDYIGLQLRSIGRYRAVIDNMSEMEAEITLSVAETYYPIEVYAKTVTSDDKLNKVLSVCGHSLKYCRQLMHLDSPLHSEPLACTGDYYIESLMTAFSYGDMRLAEFDVIRTAEILRFQSGDMFHTTYSLIWILMLYDVYKFTGHKCLLSDCEDALLMLLDRMESFVGENGIIENPLSYMFIDWLLVDDISLHHPPKALGQTCLNMFYYGGLITVVKIFECLGKGQRAEKYRQLSKNLRNAINNLLYDKERKLYFEGLNTPTPEHLIGTYMPQNVSKRYFRKHANVLAAYFGVYDGKGEELLIRTLEDESLGVYQPYFGHFVLEAVRLTGLCDRYTMDILNNWKKPVEECGKGLPEGFYAPEPTYSFDHSHAWAGTPLYALPMALTGFEMVEPEFKKVRFSPNLLGLSYATVEIPTKYGMITVKLQQGKQPVIDLPDGVELCKSGKI